jgi:hypothetical protein
MRRTPIFLIAACLLLVSCQKDYYSPDQVEIKAEGYTGDGIALHFIPPTESNYYCPGVTFDIDGDTIRYRFVRAHVNDTPEVDASAENRDGKLVVLFPMREDQRRIKLIDDDGIISKWEITPDE